MKMLLCFVTAILVVSNSWAGGAGSSSTGGTRPTPNSLNAKAQASDWVKFNSIEGRKVEFYYKDGEGASSGLYKADVNQINGRVVEALKKSKSNRSWEIVVPDAGDQY